MKKKNYIYLILSFVAATVIGCSQDDFNGYKADNFIHFSKNSTDSTTFSFAYDESLTEGEVELRMNIISPFVNKDRTFAIRFIEKESTAKEGRDFSLQSEKLVVKANDSIGIVKIHVMKTEAIKGKSVRAIFEVSETPDFKPGIVQNRKAKLVITDKLTRPDWWNSWHEGNGLGRWSEKKFRLFIRVTGQTDLTLKENGGHMEYYDMRVYVTMFKYWLIDNPQTEDNGEEMSVPILG